MLIELRLENYAVIDNLAVEFAPGLNLLTGETGAGKSILIDALALLLGGKASAGVSRAGADRATGGLVAERLVLMVTREAVTGAWTSFGLGLGLAMPLNPMSPKDGETKGAWAADGAAIGSTTVAAVTLGLATEAV